MKPMKAGIEICRYHSSTNLTEYLQKAMIYSVSLSDLMSVLSLIFFKSLPTAAQQTKQNHHQGHISQDHPQQLIITQQPYHHRPELVQLWQEHGAKVDPLN